MENISFYKGQFSHPALPCRVEVLWPLQCGGFYAQSLEKGEQTGGGYYDRNDHYQASTTSDSFRNFYVSPDGVCVEVPWENQDAVQDFADATEMCGGDPVSALRKYKRISVETPEKVF